jgi:hypothetical protein
MSNSLIEKLFVADIRNMQRIRAVIVNGKLLDRPDLDRLLAEAERAAQNN